MRGFGVGWMLGLARAGVAWFVCGGSLCGVVALLLRDFLMGFVLSWEWAGLGYGWECVFFNGRRVVR